VKRRPWSVNTRLRETPQARRGMDGNAHKKKNCFFWGDAFAGREAQGFTLTTCDLYHATPFALVQHAWLWKSGVPTKRRSLIRLRRRVGRGRGAGVTENHPHGKVPAIVT